MHPINLAEFQHAKSIIIQSAESRQAPGLIFSTEYENNVESECVDDILAVIRPKLPLILSGELAISMTNARHDTPVSRY